MDFSVPALRDRAYSVASRPLIQTVVSRTLAKEISQSPDIREKRLHSLRQAIHQGRYGVSAHEVAEALITHLWMVRAA